MDINGKEPFGAEVDSDSLPQAPYHKTISKVACLMQSKIYWGSKTIWDITWMKGAHPHAPPFFPVERWLLAGCPCSLSLSPSKGCRSHFIKLEARGRRICIFCHHRSCMRVVLGYWVLNFYWSTLNIELGGCSSRFCANPLLWNCFCQCFLREREILSRLISGCFANVQIKRCVTRETWGQINFSC